MLATRLARSEYFQMLTRWLDKRLPRGDELIFCGGTAHLFKLKLNLRYTVFWDADIEIPPTLDTSALGIREFSQIGTQIGTVMLCLKDF